MIHRSAKFEEYMSRIVDHVRPVVTRLTLRFEVNRVQTWANTRIYEPDCMDAAWKDSSRTDIEYR